MWFAIVIAYLSVCEYGASCNVGHGKTTCITEDLLQMMMGISNRKDSSLQPAFFAFLKQQPYTLTGINDVVKFEDVTVNRGQGYNRATGVFTAPRKGLYHISCSIMAYSTNNVHYQLNKNDAAHTYAYSSNYGYVTSTINAIVEMKKGDRVFIKHRYTSSAQKISGDHLSTFSGFFMQK